MTRLAQERHRAHQYDSHGEFLLRRQVQFAKAVLPIVVNEAADAPFVTVEETLTRLNVAAEDMISERGKPTRKVRRALLRYARRLLEITEQEPDLLNARSISLVAHAADATGVRGLLETTLDQAHNADLTANTDVNIQAIEAALELDVPFSEAMKTLNELVVPFSDEPIIDHVPLSEEYNYLFEPDPSRVIRQTSIIPVDEHGQPIDVERPLFRK